MGGQVSTSAHVTTPDGSRKRGTVSLVSTFMGEARVECSRDLRRKQPNVDPARIGAIVYCFGGGVVLQMARSGENLRGVVSVHGVLDTAAPAKAGAVKADVLVLTGGADPYVTKDQVDELDR